MKLTETETFEKNGVSYTTNIYDNGAKETFPADNPPRIAKPPILTEMEHATLETAANTELLVALAELG